MKVENLKTLIGKQFWSAKFFEYDLSKTLEYKNVHLKDVVFGRATGKIHFDYDLEDGSKGIEVTTTLLSKENLFKVEKIEVYDRQTGKLITRIEE